MTRPAATDYKVPAEKSVKMQAANWKNNAPVARLQGRRIARRRRVFPSDYRRMASFGSLPTCGMQLRYILKQEIHNYNQ